MVYPATHRVEVAQAADVRYPLPCPPGPIVDTVQVGWGAVECKDPPAGEDAGAVKGEGGDCWCNLTQNRASAMAAAQATTTSHDLVIRGTPVPPLPRSAHRRSRFVADHGTGWNQGQPQ